MAQQRIKHRLIIRGVTTRHARGRGHGGIRIGGAGALRPAFSRYHSHFFGKIHKDDVKAKMVSQVTIPFKADTSKWKRQVSETDEYVRGWLG